MRLVAFLFLQLASIAVTYCSTSQDNQVSADQLYTQITHLIPQMEQTRDSVTYYQLLYQTLSKALVCDSIDALPDKKGKSVPQHRKQLSRQLRTLRPHLIDGGMMYYAHRDNPTALRFFHLYLQSHSSPLFRLSDKQQDAYLGAVSYYASLLAYGEKLFREADHYADIALNDSNVAEDAAEIKVNCMRELMRTPLDSSRYELALLALHDNAGEFRKRRTGQRQPQCQYLVVVGRDLYAKTRLGQSHQGFGKSRYYRQYTGAGRLQYRYLLGRESPGKVGEGYGRQR